jgi:hypothetical protein
MTVLETLSVGATPVALKIVMPIVMGSDPQGASERRAGPVTFVPAVVSVNRIPVAIHPHVTRPRAWGRRIDSGRWGRTNVDPEGDCAEGGRARQ